MSRIKRPSESDTSGISTIAIPRFRHRSHLFHAKPMLTVRPADESAGAKYSRLYSNARRSVNRSCGVATSSKIHAAPACFSLPLSVLADGKAGIPRHQNHRCFDGYFRRKSRRKSGHFRSFAVKKVAADCLPRPASAAGYMLALPSALPSDAILPISALREPLLTRGPTYSWFAPAL